MTVVAGPPGSGKSALFPAARFNVPAFNADDRAAQLNGNSYHQIPHSVRTAANREFEAFIKDRIEQRQSFAFESTLRTDSTFRQASQARELGFEIVMYYVALESVEMNLQRVRTRFDAGGHAASERVLRSIHAALREIDAVIVFDNTAAPVVAKPTLRTISSRVTWRVQSVSPWLIRALRDTEFHLDA